jgi:LacI family transcriptional regulator
MDNSGVSMREIAVRAGVSIASVSRALSGKDAAFLSTSLRNHILQVCQELKYHPNEHTRRMFSQRANTVAMFFPPVNKISNDIPESFTHAKFNDCMLGAQVSLAEHGIDLLLTETSANFISAKRYLNMVRGKIIDGILLWGVHNIDEYIHELLNENIPLVMLQTAIADCNCSKVVADDFTGTYNLTRRLLQAGHRQIAIASPWSTSSAGRERLRGIIAALNEAELKPVYVTSQMGYGYSFGLQATAEILENSKAFTAIIASNDMAAWGCIDELKKHNLLVPEDISVVGADGLKIPGEVQVSSFYSPSYEIGKLGAEILLKQLDGVRSIENICLPVTPVAGNTIKSKLKPKKKGIES